MSLKYVQTNTLYQAGAGNIIGATSVVLTTFTDIYANVLTMTDFGAKGYGTLEPDTTNEEAFTFTGVSANANGTYTLTGVSTALAKSPYTETSGLVRQHSGGTKVVITDNVAFWNTFGNTANTNTWADVQTFSVPAVQATNPTGSTQVANKAYVDGVAVAGAPNASTTVKGIVELATQAESDARTTTGGTGALLVPTPDTQRSTLLSDYVADTGAADVAVITPVPAITAYATGQRFIFKVVATNLTTTPTLNVNGKGAKTIVKLGGSAMVAGDLLIGQVVEVEYDGTNMQLMSPVARTISTNSSSQIPALDGSLVTGIMRKQTTFTTDVVIASSTVETTLMTVSVPGATLGTSGGLFARINYNLLRITNTKTAIFRVKYGATTLITLTLTGAQASQTDNLQGFLDVCLLASGATNSQEATLTLNFADSAVGDGSVTAGSPPIAPWIFTKSGTSAEDSTAAKTFAITFQLNNSSVNDTLTALNGFVYSIQ